MNDYKAIILDMDGVVIDSEPLHEKAQQIIFDQYGLDVPPSAMVEVKGRTEVDVFEYLLENYATRPLDAAELIAAKHDAYAELIHEMEMIPDALAFIERVHGRYKLALTTSSVPADQVRAFAKFELHDYFEVVVTSEDITRPKPDPQPYKITTEKLDLDPGDCLVVEDSIHGINSACRAGCAVAGITTSFEADLLYDAGADFVIDTFGELALKLDLPLAG